MSLTVTYIGTTLNPGNNSLLDSQLLALGNLLGQSARAAQFMALIYGVCQFSNILISRKGLNKLKGISKMFCKCFHKDRSLCTVIVHTIILVGILMLYGLAAYPPPILLMIWFKEFAGWHKENVEQNASIGYTALAWFHHISDLIIRIIMGGVTRLIMIAWISEQEKLWSILNSENPKCEKFKSMVQSYKQTGKVIAALQGIFQVWFVMTWIVYFIGITGNTVLVLKTLLLNQIRLSSHRFWFYLAHLIYDIVVFLIPYIYGGLMNYYHDNYRETLEEVQERLLHECEDLSECLLQSASLIPENPKYRFVPALCCLSIPLESAGYTITIVLTLFAFLLTLITDFTDV